MMKSLGEEKNVKGQKWQKEKKSEEKGRKGKNKYNSQGSLTQEFCYAAGISFFGPEVSVFR